MGSGSEMPDSGVIRGYVCPAHKPVQVQLCLTISDFAEQINVNKAELVSSPLPDAYQTGGTNHSLALLPHKYIDYKC